MTLDVELVRVIYLYWISTRSCESKVLYPGLVKLDLRIWICSEIYGVFKETLHKLDWDMLDRHSVRPPVCCRKHEVCTYVICMKLTETNKIVGHSFIVFSWIWPKIFIHFVFVFLAYQIFYRISIFKTWEKRSVSIVFI